MSQAHPALKDDFTVNESATHPCHTDQVKNLKRIEGQVRGIQGMIEEGKYCVDILNQVKAVRKALITVESNILKTHLQMCIKESFSSATEADEKIEELIKVLKR